MGLDIMLPATLRAIGGALPPVFDADQACLVIIDAQNEYASGPLALEGLDEALEEIATLRTWAATAGVPTIHVQHLGRDGGPIFAPASHGFDFLRAARPAEGEPVVAKRFPNSFHETDLVCVLDKIGRRQLLLAGFMAHMCIDATARAGYDRGFEIFVVASATADRALPGIAGVIGADQVKAATMAALGDRFAHIVGTAAELVQLRAAA